ncbi:hypothetical protein [Gemmatimonas phototrophica]|uniref:Uncharacterized protein n=1 Tax=Gemmatimonas phototrophica TaxID=1379270 RepID=A0A143BMG4_9BACT|nr:hypothetical protein [Gemmatimonas phototrophica]AMW05661.1 hypothetical protein GEMMAAP_14325 [Gemmatimonas phototrophica]
MSQPTSGHRAARDLLDSMYRDVAHARDTAVAALAMPSHTTATVPIALVPLSRAPLHETSAHRHAMLAQRIRELLATMRQTTADQDDGLIEQPAPLSHDQTRVVVAVCSACRGHCCTNGREHAFLRVRTLRDYAAAHPEHTDEAIVQAYLAHLPTHALHPGCVYQGERGCTLPREMRSAICNSYLCTGLQMAVDGTSPDTVGVFVAHREGRQVNGGELRALPVLE